MSFELNLPDFSIPSLSGTAQTKGRKPRNVSSGDGRVGYHMKRASLGVWAASISDESRQKVLAWKEGGCSDGLFLVEVVKSLAVLIREWGPVLPVNSCLTVPPQGASGDVYAAQLIGEGLSRAIERPFVKILYRVGSKAYHHPQESVGQDRETTEGTEEGFYAEAGQGRIYLVVDDVISSGTTMRLSLGAIRRAGSPAFGFAWVGS